MLAYHGQSEIKAWSASGLSLPSTNNCDQKSAPGERQIAYGYDARNRLTSTSYGDGSPAVSRSYTPDGLLQQTTTHHAAHPVTWTYEYYNRRILKRESYSGGWSFAWGVDAHGHTTSLTDPWGTMDYAPNALGQPTQVGWYVSNVTYHPSGAVAGYTLGNLINHSTTLNARGLPLRMSNSGISQDLYTYDANGNVTGIVDEQEGINTRSMPDYDGLDRLRQASGPWGTGTYTYDALDNLTSSALSGSGGAPARVLSHNIDAGTNRLASLSGTLSVGFAYDANGNIVQRAGQSFTFDIGNRMASAPGKVNYYLYDGHGRRMLVWYANGSHMHQAYTMDGKLRFGQHSVEGHTRFVYLGDKLIAETTSAATVYQHVDALGSPVARTNGSGGLISRTRYEPYGATVAGSTGPTNIGFTGHVNDADTGLVYMQQRYYEPLSGRFLSVDPVLTDAEMGEHFNRYVYADNSPYRVKDPDGRAPQAFDCDCSGGTTNAGLPTSPIVTLQIVAIQNGASPAAAARLTSLAVAVLPAARLGVSTTGSKLGGAAKSVASGADNAGHVLKLKNQLASQAQMAEAGTIMAGPGGRVAFRDAQRVASEHGGNAADWVKKTSSSFTDGKGTRFETHWVENSKTGQRVEFKTKFSE